MKRITFILVIAIILNNILGTAAFSSDAATRKDYVNKLRITTKVLTMNAGSKRKVNYKVVAKGKVSKKISVKVKNKKIVKASVKKSKIILIGKKAGTTKVVVTTKARNKKGKNIKKVISVKVLPKNEKETDKQTISTDSPILPTETPFVKPTVAPTVKPDDAKETAIPENNYYSRAEWVSILADKLKFDVSNTIDEDLYYFSDTKGETYGLYAELAKAWDLLPECDSEGYKNEKMDVPEFEGDKLLTKEYAVYTIVKALGFIPDEQVSLSCKDLGILKFPIIDGIAVAQNIAELDSSNCFCPDDVLTRQEADGLLDKISEFEKTAQVDKGQEVENIEYDNGSVSSIIYAGQGEADLDNITTTEGVQYRYEEDENIDELHKMQGKIGGSVKIPGKLSFSLASKKISNKLNVSGKVDVSIPDVTCKLDVDFGLDKVSFKEFVVSMTEKIKVKSDLSCDKLKNTKWEKGKAEIGRVPVRLGMSGLSVDVIFFLEISAKGKASIAYTIQATNGFQYINGSPRVIKDYTQSYEELNLSGDFKAGLGISLALSAPGNIDLCEVDFSAGLGAKAAFTRHTDVSPELCCGDGILYLYADCALSKEAALGKFLDEVCKLSWSADIYNEKNSKFKTGIHIENNQIVDECTYGTGSIEGTVFDSAHSAINRARVQMYQDGDILVKTVYSDENGNFAVTGLSPSQYKIKISKTGYRVFELDKEVEKAKVSYLNEITLVEQDGTESDEPEENIPVEEEAIRNPRVADGITTWDCLYFGKYWQSDTNGDGKANENDDKEPIKWRVLSVDGNNAVLLADKCLDSQPYNDSGKATTWANSSIRSWLSTTFMNRAFEDKERTALRESNNQNDNNPPSNSYGDPINESSTSDLIYLLSIEQACKEVYGFASDFCEMSDSRIAYNTEFASEIESAWNGSNQEGTWYLRTPTKFYFISSVANVSYSGQGVYYDGMHSAGDVSSIRPAIQIDLSATDLWQYAGTVSSDGTVSEPGEDGDKKIMEAGDCYKFLAKEDVKLYYSGIALYERCEGEDGNVFGMYACDRINGKAYIPLKKGESREFKVIKGSLEFETDNNISIQKINHDPLVKIVLHENDSCQFTANSDEKKYYGVSQYDFDARVYRTLYYINGDECVTPNGTGDRRNGQIGHVIDEPGNKYGHNTIKLECLEGTSLVFISWYDYAKKNIIMDKGKLATEEELEEIYHKFDNESDK